MSASASRNSCHNSTRLNCERVMEQNPANYITVEIYNQTYHLSGQDADHIRKLAAQVDAKMRAVAAQGRTVDSLRVAVLAALNLADDLSQTQEGASGLSARVGHARAASLRGLLDEVLEEERKTGS
jgi:cell division protein ZapA